jgi:hypothetical protein
VKALISKCKRLINKIKNTIPL